MITTKHTSFVRYFFKTLAFCGLLVGVVFFVQDVWNEYSAKVTSVKQYSEWQDKQKIASPTITFCFNPPIKMSSLNKYNVNLPEYLGYESIITNLTLFEEGIYKKDRDFRIIPMNGNFEPIADDQIVVEEMFTIWNGRCYKIRPKFTMIILDYFVVNITMNDSKDNVDVEWYFTSESNSYGVIFDEWMDGTPLRYSTNTMSDFNYYVTLQTFKEIKLELSSNCQQNARPVECGSTKYARNKIFKYVQCVTFEMDCVYLGYCK